MFSLDGTTKRFRPDVYPFWRNELIQLNVVRDYYYHMLMYIFVTFSVIANHYFQDYCRLISKVLVHVTQHTTYRD